MLFNRWHRNHLHQGNSNLIAQFINGEITEDGVRQNWVECARPIKNKKYDHMANAFCRKFGLTKQKGNTGGNYL